MFILKNSFIEGKDVYLVILIMTLAAIFDISTCRIPNWFIGISFLVSQAWIVSEKTVGDGLLSIGMAVLLICTLYPVFMIGAVGAGDCKTLMILTCYFSYRTSLKIILLAMGITAGAGLIKLIKNNELRVRIENLFIYLLYNSKAEHIQIYDQHHGQQRLASNQIHFTVPILISVILVIGGYL